MMLAELARNSFDQQALRSLELFEPFRGNLATFGGVTVEILPERVWQQLDAGQRSDCRQVSLQALVYDRFYCRDPLDAVPAGDWDRYARDLPEALNAVNAGRGSVEPRWKIVNPETRPRISNGRLSLAVPAHRRDAEDDPRGAEAPAPEGHGRYDGYVLTPNHFLKRSPGFYLAVGDEQVGTGKLLRLYFHASPEGAVPLTRVLTRQLNDRGIAYQLKVLLAESAAARRDSVVVYVRREAWAQARAVMSDHREELQRACLSTTPRFTLPLLPGMSLAADLGHGTSFGFSRSGFVASALLTCHADSRGGPTPADFLAALRGEFRAAGATLSSPYLRSRQDPVPFDDVPVTARRRRTQSSGRCRDAAVTIADHLSSEAIWSGGSCTWLGPTLGASPWPEAPLRVLGPDLYEGAAGVGVFLANAARILADDRLAETAVGAVNYGLTAVERDRQQVRGCGLFTGWPGICLAGALVATLLDDDRLLQRSISVAAWRDGIAGEHEPLDLLDGFCGKVVAFAGLARMSATGDMKRILVRDLRHLATVAPRLPTGGLAHGRQGAVMARAAAVAAGLPEAGPTPGTAQPTGRRSPDDGQESCSWCRGVGGHLVSSYLTAMFGGNTPPPTNGALAAKLTTSVVQQLSGGIRDFSLCHGICGQASILAATGPARRDGPAGEAVNRVAAAVSGLLTGPDPNFRGRFASPSLMQGTAGIGLFLLHLVEPTTVKPLMGFLV